MSKLKYYHLYAECVDQDGEKHVVTVVGRFTQNYVPKEITQEVPVEVKPGSTVKGKLTFSKRTLHRTLTVGVSMLTEDLIMAELVGKLAYICNNIDSYLP